MLQWCCAGWGAARGGTVRLLYTLYADGCICGKEALSLLTCSDIVLHESSELYILPTNIYSCHSSTVRRCHLQDIM